jgi:hypothetical protein
MACGWIRIVSSSTKSRHGLPMFGHTCRHPTKQDAIKARTALKAIAQNRWPRSISSRREHSFLYEQLGKVSQ